MFRLEGTLLPCRSELLGSKLAPPEAPWLSLARDERIEVSSALGRYHLSPGWIKPRCNKKRGVYITKETRSVVQNHTYSPASRSGRKCFPIQHQYYGISAFCSREEAYMPYWCGDCIIFPRWMSVDTKTNSNPEDHETKCGAIDKHRGGSVEVSKPPYYQKSLNCNDL